MFILSVINVGFIFIWQGNWYRIHFFANLCFTLLIGTCCRCLVLCRWVSYFSFILKEWKYCGSNYLVSLKKSTINNKISSKILITFWIYYRRNKKSRPRPSIGVYFTWEHSVRTQTLYIYFTDAISKSSHWQITSVWWYVSGESESEQMSQKKLRYTKYIIWNIRPSNYTTTIIWWCHII